MANLHETYTFLTKQINEKYTSETLKKNYHKILVAMIPVIPHFASECLKMLNKDVDNKWPSYDVKYLEENIIQIVVQINGKKRGLIKTKKDTTETEVLEKIKNNEKLKKYINDKKINKKIFVPNKIINLII